MGVYVPPVPPRPTKCCYACGQTIDAMAVVCPKCGGNFTDGDGYRITEWT